MCTDVAVAAHLAADNAWNRGFAAIYAPLIKVVELAGVSAARREVVERAAGGTLEVGAGMGHALPHYGSAVSELILTEPDIATPDGWSVAWRAPAGRRRSSAQRPRSSRSPTPAWTRWSSTWCCAPRQTPRALCERSPAC